ELSVPLLTRVTLRAPRRCSAARFRGAPFLVACSAQEVLDRLVPCVALDRKQRRTARPERPLRGPGGFPGIGILDRHAVAQRVRIDAREPLADVGTLAGAEIARVAAEVGGVDDERVSLVTADGVPQPPADGRRQVRAVDANHAG